MAPKLKTAFAVSHYAKYSGLVLIAVGIPTMMLDNAPSAEIPLLVGLFMLLVSSTKIEDERCIQIRTSSLYIAFIISYGMKLLVTNLHDHGLISRELVEINHFLIIVLALANSIFYGRLYVLKF